MSFQITEAFVQQYSSNFLILSQQKESRLQGAVRVETGIVGTSKKFNRIGATAAQKKIGRHTDTPLIETPHSSRYVDMDDYEWADLIDDLDKQKMLASPQSEYLMAGVMAMNRVKDDVIYTAMRGLSRSPLGNIALPTSQKIAAAGTGLTKAKLITARKLFRANESDEMNGDDLYLSYGAEQLEDLLADTTLTNTESNTILSMISGDLPEGRRLFGFKTIPIERLAKSGNDRYAVAWAKSGIVLGIGQETKTRVSERDDKSYATQVYASQSLGAVRMEEVKVVEIACTE